MCRLPGHYWHGACGGTARLCPDGDLQSDLHRTNGRLALDHRPKIFGRRQSVCLHYGCHKRRRQNRYLIYRHHQPEKIEVGQKLCIPAVTAVPGRELAGIYTTVGPAADASALVETLVLGGDGQARYTLDYIGKA